MANSPLTPSVIAKEALMRLENDLVMSKLVYRAYEKDFATPSSNGYKIGDTLTIRKPAQYTVRDGDVASMQDSVEGSTTIVIDKIKGIDLQFSSKELTLDIDEFSERFLADGMSKLANQVDTDLYDLALKVPNWVGTPGQTINSFSDFGAAPQRMDELAVPQTKRKSVLSNADYWAMLTSFSTLFANQGKTAEDALRKAWLGNISNVDTYKAQNIKTFTRGTATNTTPAVDGASQVSTYASVKTTDTQSLLLKAAGNAVTYVEGDIFTIADVYAVNPVSKATLPFLRQFVVTTAATASAGGAVTLTISPAIITSGAYQNVSAAPADSALITILGTASTGYAQNIFFHENAFALCMVPMELPDAATYKARQSYKGLSVRIVGDYDIINNKNLWRLDILYGVKALDPRLAVRASGAA